MTNPTFVLRHSSQLRTLLRFVALRLQRFGSGASDWKRRIQLDELAQPLHRGGA
jgi:hypothetical protein